EGAARRVVATRSRPEGGSARSRPHRTGPIDRPRDRPLVPRTPNALADPPVRLDGRAATRDGGIPAELTPAGWHAHQPGPAAASQPVRALSCAGERLCDYRFLPTQPRTVV